MTRRGMALGPTGPRAERAAREARLRHQVAYQYPEAESDAEIARALGVDSGVVARVRRELGLKAKRRKGAE